MPPHEPSADAVPPARRPLPRRIWIGGLLVAASVALLLVPLDNQYRARWYAEAADAGHVVLFALLAWGLAVCGGPRMKWPAALLCAALAVAAEVVQPFIGRSASWRDLAYGLMGVGMALVWLSPARIGWRATGVVALAIWPTVRTGPLLIDAVWAWHTFPVLARFDSPIETRRWYFEQVQVVSTNPGSAIFEFAPSERGSSAILFPVVRDFTEYQTLEVDFAFAGPPMTFLISVRDGKKLPPELPRYDLWRRYEPGKHQVRIDLAELARGGDFPPIELDRVQSVHLVAYSDQVQVVKVLRIELTGRKSPLP